MKMPTSKSLTKLIIKDLNKQNNILYFQSFKNIIKRITPEIINKNININNKSLQSILLSSLNTNNKKDNNNTNTISNEPLPDILWKPEEEFQLNNKKYYKFMNLHLFIRNVEISNRIMKTALRSVIRPTPIILLGCFSSLVIGISIYEIKLILNPNHIWEGNDKLLFILKYIKENYLASCMWESREPDIIAMSMGYKPNEILRTFNDTQIDALLKLQILRLESKRSIVGGFMVMAQLLSIVTASIRAVDVYSNRIYNGTEPPLKVVNERIIRLAGSSSDVTELSMNRYYDHILPVYEDPSKIRHLVDRWSLKGTIPCYWMVRDTYYGYSYSWKRLIIDKKYMLRTTTGRFILCIEADATNSDKALDFGEKSQDLSIEDASQAFRMIERQARKNKNNNYNFRVLRVFLGDSLQESTTGGIVSLTLRDRITQRNESDIIIDSKAPLLLAILKWCKNFPEKDRKIIIDASPEYYFALKEILLQENIITYDETEAEKILINNNNIKDKNKIISILPRLIYHSSTASTVNAIHALISAGKADASRCCVLINNIYGLEHLEDLKINTKNRFKVICAAEIYDNYFRQIRIWSRMGYSSVSIQMELDNRFKNILKLQEFIKIQQSKKLLGIKNKFPPISASSTSGIATVSSTVSSIVTKRSEDIVPLTPPIKLTNSNVSSSNPANNLKKK